MIDRCLCVQCPFSLGGPTSPCVKQSAINLNGLHVILRPPCSSNLMHFELLYFSILNKGCSWLGCLFQPSITISDVCTLVYEPYMRVLQLLLNERAQKWTLSGKMHLKSDYPVYVATSSGCFIMCLAKTQLEIQRDFKMLIAFSPARCNDLCDLNPFWHFLRLIKTCNIIIAMA